LRIENSSVPPNTRALIREVRQELSVEHFVKLIEHEGDCEA
jgi:hypothetical protein